MSPHDLTKVNIWKDDKIMEKTSAVAVVTITYFALALHQRGGRMKKERPSNPISMVE